VFTEMRPDGYQYGAYTIQGARAVDSATSQWMTPDWYPGTLDNPTSQRTYTWVGNNPVTRSDPTGFSYDNPCPEGQVDQGAGCQPDPNCWQCTLDQILGFDVNACSYCRGGGGGGYRGVRYDQFGRPIFNDSDYIHDILWGVQQQFTWNTAATDGTGLAANATFSAMMGTSASQIALEGVGGEALNLEGEVGTGAFVGAYAYMWNGAINGQISAFVNTAQGSPTSWSIQTGLVFHF